MKETQEMLDCEAKFNSEVYEIVAATGEIHWTSVAINETLSILTMDILNSKRTDEHRSRFHRTALYHVGDAKKLEELQKEMLPLSIYRLKVRDNGSSFLLIDMVEKNVQDEDMNESLRIIERINTIQDPTFGDLVLTNMNEVYQTKIDWMGRSVYLYLNWEFKDTDTELEDLLETAHQIYANKQSWDERIRKFVAEYLQQKSYDDWPIKKEENEAEKEQTVKTFIKYLLPETLLIYKGGRFEIWFQRNWLTGGSLSLKATLQDGPLLIDMEKEEDDIYM
ncbi:MAG: DUF2262 domain-containing protein [Bacteroides sp.]|nr:DUF2262 domain-containing protein [Bacteroides sp.]